jgi:hypothetical protein
VLADRPFKQLDACAGLHHLSTPAPAVIASFIVRMAMQELHMNSITHRRVLQDFAGTLV